MSGQNWQRINADGEKLIDWVKYDGKMISYDENKRQPASDCPPREDGEYNRSAAQKDLRTISALSQGLWEENQIGCPFQASSAKTCPPIRTFRFNQYFLRYHAPWRAIVPAAVKAPVFIHSAMDFPSSQVLIKPAI